MEDQDGTFHTLGNVDLFVIYEAAEIYHQFEVLRSGNPFSHAPAHRT